mgnify:CR=1 FL=1
MSPKADLKNLVPCIAERGASSSQLQRVLELKLDWFDRLKRSNSSIDLVHPLIARIKISAAHSTALADRAAQILSFMRDVYLGKSDALANSDMSALCQHLAENLATCPNVTPGGVIQSRPFFSRSMERFQDAWRECVLGTIDPIKFTYIQSFANLRIVPGKISAELASRPFATTTLHSDVWIGEPIDSINGWIGLCGDIENNFIQFFNTSPGFVADHFSHERRYDAVLSRLQSAGISFSPILESIAPNVLYLFDCLIPHRTCIASGGARLSIDGRFRTGILTSAECRGPVNMVGIEALTNQYRRIADTGQENPK